MGVPKFAAWLTKKYPAMVEADCPPEVHGLYIDLNGLIHPCCHDEDDPTVALRSEEDKLKDICLSIETLVQTTLPQSVIYIAIDGVAPRAKMNQQRARRYMSAAAPVHSSDTDAGIVSSIEKEFSPEERASAGKALEEVHSALHADPLYGGGKSADLAEADHTETVLDELLPSVDDLLESNNAAKKVLTKPKEMYEKNKLKDENAFDSNCLSPGTVFMEKVSHAVHSFIIDKMGTASLDEAQDAAAASRAVWQRVTVIFSDSNVPGEGEHKLIDFLRTQSSFGNFNGHGAHVLAGLDADLIFLSLSLHIPKVIILRDNGRESPLTQLLRRCSKEDEDKDKAAAARKSGDRKGKKKTEEDDDDDFKSESEPEDDGVNVRDEDDVAESTAISSEEDLRQKRASEIAVGPNYTYQYYDIDVVGASIVSEIYQLCRVKDFELKDRHFIADLAAVNGYKFYNNTYGGHVPDPAKLQHTIAEFHPCTGSSNSKIIDDFIVLGMIMGNDFLPRTPAAFCGESVMDIIFEIYVRDVLPHGYLTAGDHDIDLKQLSRFFKSFAEVEAMLFRQYIIQSTTQKSSTAAKDYDDMRIMYPEEGLLPLVSSKDAALWREPYYSSTSISSSTQEIERSCFYYVQGMRFVWSYYSKTSREVSWSWQYPYFHAPFCYDMHCYLEKHIASCQKASKNVQIEIPPAAVEKEAPNTLTQLLCILPPSSCRLVPQCLREMMLHPPSEELSRTFPRSWEVDYTAAFSKDHLATVMTPLASLDALKAIVAEYASQLSGEETVRNTNRNFHLVFRSADRTTKEDVRGGSKATNNRYVFEIKGDGVDATPLETKEENGVLLSTLEEVAPELTRPRTYTHNTLIPNLSRLPNQSIYKGERRPRWGKRNGQGVRRNNNSNANANNRNDKYNQNKEDKKKGDDNANLVVLPNFAEFHIIFAFIVLLVSFMFIVFQSGNNKTTSLGFFGSIWNKVFITPFYQCLFLLQILSVLLFSLILSYLIGFATLYHRKGSGIMRNSVPRVFIDWQCAHCLSLNFSKNKKCYFCSFPFSDSRCTAIYSNKMKASPPLYEPNHSLYKQRFGFNAEQFS